MDISGPVAILLFFLLLLVDMFFMDLMPPSTTLNEKEILHKAEEEKDRRSVRLSEMVSRPGIYINTVQLVITLINILMGAFYLNIWLQTIDNGLHVINVGGLSLQNVPTGVISGIATVLSFVAMIYILLTFGVLIPRKMASRKTGKAGICLHRSDLLDYETLISLDTGLVNLTAKGILFLFGVRNNTDENDVTEEEIINMVQEGHEQGVIQASEAEMISNIFEYGDKEAQDIMTHTRKYRSYRRRDEVKRMPLLPCWEVRTAAIRCMKRILTISSVSYISRMPCGSTSAMTSWMCPLVKLMGCSESLILCLRQKILMNCSKRCSPKNFRWSLL